MSNIWDQFQKPDIGDYPERWRPETVGDTITGVITSIRVATMPDGNTYPSIGVKTNDGDREILASQAMLLRQLASVQPKTGDTITITFLDIEKLSGGRTLKQFNVEINKQKTTTEDIL